MRNTMSAMLAVILMICMSQTVLISEPLSVIEKSHTTSNALLSDGCDIDDTGSLWNNDSTLFRNIGGIHVCDEETGNWTVLDDKQTTDKEWVVEQGCDAPTEQQLSDTNLAEVLNDYGQVMVAGSDWKNNTNQSWYDMVAATSTGHDDPNDPMIHFETRIVSGCSGQLCRDYDIAGVSITNSSGFESRGLNTADEPIYMRNTAIQIGPDIEIEFSSSSGLGGTIMEYAYSVHFNGTYMPDGEYTPKVHFNGSTVIVSITNSTGHEVINVTQTQDRHTLDVADTAERWSNNTMYDSYDGATVQTNTHISIAKNCCPDIGATTPTNGSGGRGVRSGYDVDLSYSETTINSGDWIIDNNTVVENERTGLLFLKGKAIQVGFGEDGDVTEANIIKNNLTIVGHFEWDAEMSPIRVVPSGDYLRVTADLTIDAGVEVQFAPGKAIDMAGGTTCEAGLVTWVEGDIDLSKNRVAGDDDDNNITTVILVSAAGVDVTERDAVAVGGTFAVTSILWMIGRRYLGGV